MTTPGATWLYHTSLVTDGKVEFLDPKNPVGDDAVDNERDDDLKS